MTDTTTNPWSVVFSLPSTLLPEMEQEWETKGLQLQENIQAAWKSLYERYSNVLGRKNGEALTRLCLEASKKLQQE